MDDIDEAYNEFDDRLLNICNSFKVLSRKRVRYTVPSKPWISLELLALIEKRDLASRLLVLRPHEQRLRSNFRDLRNQVTARRRSDKSRFFERALREKLD
jgi:hypothetical protein